MTNVKEMHGNEIVRPTSKRWGAQLLRLAKELAPLSGLGLVALGILGWFHYEITRLDSRMDLLNQRMTTEIQNLRDDLQTQIRDVHDDLQTEMREGFRALNERIDRLLLALAGASVVPAAPGSAGRESSP